MNVSDAYLIRKKSGTFFFCLTAEKSSMEVADPIPKNETETSPARQIRRSLDCPRSDPKFVLVVQAFIITGRDLERSV